MKQQDTKTDSGLNFCLKMQSCGLALARIESLPRSPLRHSVCVVAHKVVPTPDWLPRRAGRARTHPLTAVR